MGAIKRRAACAPQMPPAEERVRQQEQRLAATYQHAGIGIVEVDGEGRLVRVNAQSCVLTGYSPDEMLGRSIFAGTDDDEDIGADREQFQRQIAGELDRYTIDRRIRRKDGTHVWASTISSSVRDADGRFLYAVRIQDDLTERRRVEEALAARIREQTALCQFTDRLQRAERLEDVYEPALDAILGALQCSRASILLHDDSGVMRFVASRGLSERYRRAVDGHSPWDPDVKDAEPICVDDVVDAAFPEPLKRVVMQEGIRAVAFIPLQPGGRLIGKFMAYYDIAHAFTPADIDLAVTIARQLGFSIERKRAGRALQASKDRLQLAMDAAQLGWWQYDPLHRTVSWDSRSKEILDIAGDGTGLEEIMKRVHPEDTKRVWTGFQTARDPADRKPYAIEFRLQRGNGEVRWVDVHWLAHFEGAQRERRAASVVGTVADITERKEHDEKERLLIREINHRAKNMLSVVDAIAHQTVAKNSDDFIERFSERIQALSANQDLLVRNEWNGVEIADLVHAQLAHFAGLIDSRIDVHGPKLRLNAASAQAIGLALHELATNAGKYGALSTDTGRVAVHWRTDGHTLTMSWTERGGPRVSAPQRRGFGTIVMETLAERSVDGTVELDYPPSGLTWRLTCPAANTVEPLPYPPPLAGEGRGGGSGSRSTTVPRGTTPTPDPSPAEPRYSEGSATQQTDRSRQQPTSVGGGEKIGRTLDELEAYALLDQLGIPRAPSVALNANTTKAPALPFGYPVALKALSSAITHKSDVGGVTLGIADAAALVAAITAMRTRLAQVPHVLVQPMIGGIGEALIGYRVDPDVGPLVLVAAGGIYTEIYRDRSLRLAPVDADTAFEMIAEVPGLKLLTGYRGKPAGDIAALAQAIAALSRLAADPAVVEAEVNPLIVSPQGVVAVDAVVRMR